MFSFIVFRLLYFSIFSRLWCMQPHTKDDHRATSWCVGWCQWPNAIFVGGSIENWKSIGRNRRLCCVERSNDSSLKFFEFIFLTFQPISDLLRLRHATSDENYLDARRWKSSKRIHDSILSGTLYHQHHRAAPAVANHLNSEKWRIHAKVTSIETVAVFRWTHAVSTNNIYCDGGATIDILQFMSNVLFVNSPSVSTHTHSTVIQMIREYRRTNAKWNETNKNI